jgi:RNA polymerase sigma-70 factor, ECF subfamily
MQRPIDRAEIDRLVVENLPIAMRFAQRLTGCSELAEEIVQEALTKVLHSWPRYRREASFSTWMLGIVLNAHRDACRRRRHEPVPLAAELPDRRPASDLFLDATELAQRMRTAIDSLPDRQREIALLCLVEQVTPGEAAPLLGITVANIHTTLHNVRKKLLPHVEPALPPSRNE